MRLRMREIKRDRERGREGERERETHREREREREGEREREKERETERKGEREKERDEEWEKHTDICTCIYIETAQKRKKQEIEWKKKMISKIKKITEKCQIALIVE